MGNAVEDQIVEFLATVPGKGVEVPAKIGKALGLKRKEVATALRSLEQQGRVVTAGVAAGVVGYKLK
jgi:hypothetical protein